MDKDDFWGKIPIRLIRDHRNKAGHLRVLVSISSCPTPHLPSMKEIAERSGHTEKYCRKMIAEMVSFGTLERKVRPGRTSIYSIPSTTIVETPSTSVVETPSTTVVDRKRILKESVKEVEPFPLWEVN